jgi:hypothetical protein
LRRSDRIHEIEADLNKPVIGARFTIASEAEAIHDKNGESGTKNG